MSLLRLPQNSLFVIIGLGRSGGRRALILRKRSELNLFAVTSLGLDSRQRLLLDLSFGLEFIPLYLDKHFFLHSEVVFVSEFIELLLVLPLQSVESLDVFIQLFFIFLHPLMMHFMEIPLFQ